VRAALISLVAVACSSLPSPKPPQQIDDRAVRLRVAVAEAKRGDGIADLVELATKGAKHERTLALRGLGRIGGATAIATLRTALGDPDKDIVAAAAAAIGLASSLDDEDLKITDALLAVANQPAVYEALGRAGDASAQPLLAKLAATEPDAALALGRHGRRKIALSDEARAALIAGLGNATTRYEATYALAREFLEKPEEAPSAPATAAALAKLLYADEPEVRAQAIAGIAKHKGVAAHAKALEQMLIDPDWRVQIEAVRALSADEYRDAVLAAAARNAPHVQDEVFRSLVGKDVDVSAISYDPFWRGILFRAPLDALQVAKGNHIKLGIIAEWLKSKAPLADRRKALAALLADADVRVRAAAMGSIAQMWTEGDGKDRENILLTVVGAVASKDPILSGSAIEAADELYEQPENKSAIERAIVSRAQNEKDVELATSLYGVIGKRAIGSGAPACKGGLAGHPVLAKAAAECLKKLGEPTAPQPDPRGAKPPSADIAAVIGKKVSWLLQTDKGLISIALRPDVAPWAVATIVELTRRRYYDGLAFHRVVPNFVVQGGDPTESGWGGPGFMIPAEPGSVLDGPGFVAGGVGIADAGRDSGGSQWFVMHSRAAHLDGRYTWIGNVLTGGKVADALRIGDKVSKAEVVIE
jgi:cyclophilin family peptidyl-prolyl cis-trans isomerase